MSSDEKRAIDRAMRGFAPAASQIYLDKQPNMSMFCKPKILPLKSPNLQMLEKMEAEANTKEIVVPDVTQYKGK